MKIKDKIGLSPILKRFLSGHKWPVFEMLVFAKIKAKFRRVNKTGVLGQCIKRNNNQYIIKCDIGKYMLYPIEDIEFYGIYIKNEEEMIVWTFAHELRHLLFRLDFFSDNSEKSCNDFGRSLVKMYRNSPAELLGFLVDMKIS